MGEVFQVEAVDGVSLHVELHRPVGTPSGIVLLSHGLAEHVGRYDELARAFTDLGCIAVGPDHRGQGSSDGRRGHVEDFGQYARDLRSVAEAVIDREGSELRPESVPWFVFGHSMGGLVALIFLIEQLEAFPLRGAILTSALLGLDFNVKEMAGKVLVHFAPRLAIDAGVAGALVCTDPELAAAYDTDNRRERRATPAWGRAMREAWARVAQYGPELRLPMLITASTGDRIVRHESILEFYDTLRRASENDQRLEVFEGAYHEPHNALGDERRRVHALYAEWIRQRLPAAAPK